MMKTTKILPMGICMVVINPNQIIMVTLVLLFIGTYFIEILYRRIQLTNQLKKEIRKFDSNKKSLIKIDISDFKLGSSHLYE